MKVFKYLENKAHYRLIWNLKISLIISDTERKNKSEMHLIVKNEILQSNNIAIKDDLGNTITYEELFYEAQELRKNIRERSLIIIICDHSFETVKIFYKCLTINCVPILLGADIESEFLEKIITTYQPDYIWCKKNYIASSSYSDIFTENTYNILKINKNKSEIHKDLALLLSTSGSTGSAKMVKISYENLYDNIHYVCLHCDIEKGQKGITALPFNYTYGFCFCLWHWYCGATLLLTKSSIVSNSFNEFFSKEQANNFAAIPYTFQMLNRLKFWDKRKLSNLHFAMSAGAQMSDALQKEMISLMGNKFWLAYGQTEVTCVVAGTNFNNDDIKLGTVGKPFQNVKIWIDENNGEMMIEGKTVSMGYALSKEDLLIGDVNNRLVRTGDRAIIDREGYIYLKGRLNRYIKILGNRIDLDEIEKFLSRQIPDCELACVGAEDEIVIFYSAEEDMESKITLELHKLHVPHKYIKFYCIDELPRNEAGKILYSKLV